MNSRERIHAAITHKPLDKFPLDIGGSVSGISKIAYDNYLLEFSPNLYPSLLYDRFQQLSYIHDDILKQWDIDTRHITTSFSEKNVNDKTYLDIFGIKYKDVFSSTYNQTIHFNQVEWPLENTRKVKDVENYNWPRIEQYMLIKTNKQAKKFYDQNYGVVLDTPFGGILNLTTWMVGLEAFITDLYLHTEFFESIIDQITHSFYIPYFDTVLSDNLGESIDIILICDDFGIQDRMIMSPQMWRKFVKPRLAKIITLIKELTDVKIQFHSCGNIYSIIPDLINMNIDILGPIQSETKDIDHHRIKTEFGQKLCFHGGIDISEKYTGQPTKKVKEKVQKVFNILGKDGTGYIQAIAHNILAEVQPEIINAFVNTRNK